MSLNRDAENLWDAWKTERATDHVPDSATPFTDAVEDLLEKRQLEDTLDALFGLDRALAEDDTLQRLHRAVLAQTLFVAVDPDTDEAPHLEGRQLYAQLVALPMLGVTADLVLADDFWGQALDTLRERAQLHLDRDDVFLDLPALAQPVRAEVCSQLKLDTWRELLFELVAAERGPRTSMLIDYDAELNSMEDPALRNSAHVQEIGQRMALGVLIYDSNEWGHPDAFEDFLEAVSDDPSWVAQFGNDQRVILSPMDLRGAMTETLAARLRLVVQIGMEDRNMTVQPGPITMQWRVLADDVERTGMVELVPEVNGVSLDPVPVPGNWLALIGPDNVTEAQGAVMDSFPDEIEADEPEPERPIRRHRLH